MEVWAAGDVKGNKAEFPRPYVKCSHGCGSIPPQDHPIAKLLNSFEDEIELSPSYSVRSFGTSFYGHEDVWNHDELRQQTIDLFLCMGTSHTELTLGTKIYKLHPYEADGTD